MKKYLTIALFLLTASSVSASSIGISPSAATFVPGESFNVSVSINPQSSTIYTAKLNLKYPADMLSVESWSFGGSWSPLNQPGYDSIDNNNGTLTKTAGYPGGLSSGAVLGTVRFKVLKEGTAQISVTGSSALYDEESENTLEGRGSGSFTISSPQAPEPVIERILSPNQAPVTSTVVTNVTKKVVVAPTSSENKISEATTSSTTSIATTTSTTTPIERKNTASGISSGTFTEPIVLIISIILAFIAGFISGQGHRKRKFKTKR